MLINSMNFMEFFEKECGVKFVDVNTGKSALDMLYEQEKQALKDRLCVNCKYALHGDGEFAHIHDILCGNGDAEYASEFRVSDDTCELWGTGGSVDG